MTSTATTTRLPSGAFVFDDILPSSVCSRCIDCYNHGNQEHWDRDGAPKFTQVNVNETFPYMVQPLVTYTLKALDNYVACFPLAKYLPPLKTLEQFRVKCYNGGSDDRYDEHIDVESPESSNRYLSFLFYLNDDYTGGQTEFSQGGTVTPRRGSVLVFPPYWMFPHAGKRVTAGTKYIMSTYMHLA